MLYEHEHVGNQVWQEGDPFPGALNGDQQNIVNFSGDSYHFFFNAFGRDSYDGAGAEMQIGQQRPDDRLPERELERRRRRTTATASPPTTSSRTSGATPTREYTHDLIYQWQPGALNESYSDIWGETVDLINGVGTDAPDTGAHGRLRARRTRRRVPVLAINSPAAIARHLRRGRRRSSARR